MASAPCVSSPAEVHGVGLEDKEARFNQIRDDRPCRSEILYASISLDALLVSLQSVFAPQLLLSLNIFFNPIKMLNFKVDKKKLLNI